MIALEAERESPLWGAALRPPAERETEPVFSPLAEERVQEEQDHRWEEK